MKIVADEKIPYIQSALHQLADVVVTKSGSNITPEDVHNADVLIVRTRTRCDRFLLQDSNVRLVVTATIGFDHLDVKWLEQNGIQWANCPGCNATSVAQYVCNSLYALQHERSLNLPSATVGIVGVGHVGTAVYRALRKAGVRRILLNDPPLETAGATAPDEQPWSTMSTLQTEADIITFHTPLTRTGVYPTWHLADATFFEGLQRQPIIINAARGGVVDEQALITALLRGRVRDTIIDTWEHEPHLSLDLLAKTFIATPHIAGYSADGKANASRMTLEQICRFMGRPMTFPVEPPPLAKGIRETGNTVTDALILYDPRLDSQLLKGSPDAFESFRNNYPVRRETF